MLAKKNRTGWAAIFFLLALVVLMAGCTPPGPRALLKGRKLLERGDYAGAVEQFKTATSLLPTNSQAWNYLGVACQQAGQFDDAATAYQRALTLDRDLVEVHYNLGSLWLEQNKLADARAEFTAYTLRRSGEPDGWLKLGLAQLRSNDLLAAEKSFSTALHLSTNNAEAFNGLGLARAKRGRANEAVQFFAAAIRYHPDFAPAYLNLATVALQDLHDNKLALEHYQAYLALTPPPENSDAVNQIVKDLEGQGVVAAAAPPPAAKTQPVETRPAAGNELKSQPVVRSAPPQKSVPSPRRVVTTPPHNAPSLPPEEVKVEPPPKIAIEENPAAAAPSRPPAASSNRISSPPPKKYVETGITPLPALTSAKTTAGSTGKTQDESKPARPIQPPAPAIPRYVYRSPSKPAAGNRVAASEAFNQAHTFEKASRWTDAMQAYRQAATLDPSWFEAQYNYGVLAYQLRDVNAALTAYETALAIEPNSPNARFNFALALKAAGYPLDAVNELKKVAAASPGDVRVQLALGNLYAQQMHDPARAREYYLKVLQMDPHNSQANDIRFWLSANPP